jgi:hypothetical protein
MPRGTKSGSGEQHSNTNISAESKQNFKKYSMPIWGSVDEEKTVVENLVKVV